jgi:hypothetical protein
MKEKSYYDGDRIITRSQALAEFPEPIFFDRATEKMSSDEIKRLVLRNVREMRRWLDRSEDLANGKVNGRVTKKHLVLEANQIHDLRVSMNVQTAYGPGTAGLWEV